MTATIFVWMLLGVGAKYSFTIPMESKEACVTAMRSIGYYADYCVNMQTGEVIKK